MEPSKAEITEALIKLGIPYDPELVVTVRYLVLIAAKQQQEIEDLKAKVKDLYGI